jgi:hypothetical protein
LVNVRGSANRIIGVRIRIRVRIYVGAVAGVTVDVCILIGVDIITG